MPEKTNDKQPLDREEKKALRLKLIKLDAELEKAVAALKRAERRLVRAFNTWQKAHKKCQRNAKHFRTLRTLLDIPKNGNAGKESLP